MYDKECDVFVTITTGQRSTLARAVVRCEDGTWIQTTGEALRHPTDSKDERVGHDLAVSRALGQLSRKMARRANGQVKCNDDNARHSARAAILRQRAEERAAKKLQQEQAGGAPVVLRDKEFETV